MPTRTYDPLSSHITGPVLPRPVHRPCSAGDLERRRSSLDLPRCRPRPRRARLERTALWRPGRHRPASPGTTRPPARERPGPMASDPSPSAHHPDQLVRRCRSAGTRCRSAAGLCRIPPAGSLRRRTPPPRRRRRPRPPSADSRLGPGRLGGRGSGRRAASPPRPRRSPSAPALGAGVVGPSAPLTTRWPTPPRRPRRAARPSRRPRSRPTRLRPTPRRRSPPPPRPAGSRS